MFAFCTNGLIAEKPALICSPRPSIPSASACCQIWKSSRVFGSNAERIPSSVTDGSTWLSASCPLSGSNGPLWPPFSGISCT